MRLLFASQAGEFAHVQHRLGTNAYILPRLHIMLAPCRPVNSEAPHPRKNVGCAECHVDTPGTAVLSHERGRVYGQA